MSSTNNHRNKSTVAAGAGLSLAGRGVSAALGLFFRRYLILLFGMEQTGLIVLGYSVVSFVAPLAQFGIPIGVQKFVAVAFSKKDWNKVRGAIFSSLHIVVSTTIAVIVLLWIFTPEISALYTRRAQNAQYIYQLPAVLRIYSIYLFPSVILAVLLAVLRAMRRIFPTFVVDSIYTPATWLALVVAVGLSGGISNKVVVLVTGLCFTTCIGIIIAVSFFRRVLPNIKNAVSVYCRRELMAFSMPLLFRSLMQMFMQIDKLMIGYFCSPAMITTYAFSAILAQQSSVVMSAFASLFSPVIAGLHSRGDSDGLRNLYKTVTRWCMAFALPIIAIVMIMPELLLAFFGIVNSPEACMTARVIAVGQLVNVAVGNTGGLLVMTNHPWLTFANNAAAVVANIVLNVVLIPRYGIVGAAIATCAAIAIRNIAALVEVNRLLSMSPFSPSLMRVIACVCAAGAAVLVFRSCAGEIKWWIELLYCLCIFGIVYTPAMWIFMAKEDKAFIVRIIRNRGEKQPSRE